MFSLERICRRKDLVKLFAKKISLSSCVNIANWFTESGLECRQSANFYPVFRVGGWTLDAADFQSADSRRQFPSNRYNCLGLRVAVNPNVPTLDGLLRMPWIPDGTVRFPVWPGLHPGGEDLPSNRICRPSLKRATADLARDRN